MGPTGPIPGEFQMETDMRASTIVDAQSGVSWAAVAAGRLARQHLLSF
jgi:hypothetical protein